MPTIYKIIESELDFLNLKAAWQELEKISNSTYPSISYDWCYLWWKVFKNVDNNTLGHNKKPAIICGYNNEKLIFVFPLMQLQRKFGPIKITFLEFLGQQWGSISNTILRLHDFDYNKLIAFIKDNVHYHILYLRQIPVDESSLFSHKIVIYSGSPYIDLTEYENKEDFLNKKYSKNLKQNIRTAYNRIKKNNLTLDLVTEEITDSNFEDIIRISKMKLIDEKYCLYLDKHKALFYKKILIKTHSNVIFVKVNNEKVAYRANILYNNSKTCIDASYDRNYRNYDTGILSVDYNFSDSFANKLIIDNMGPGLDDYKLKFTKEIQYIGYILISGSLLGSSIITNVFKKILNWRK